MRTVDVGIGHDEDFVVAHLGDVELIPDAGAQRRDDRHQLVVAVHAVGAGFLNVEHLAPQRQNRLDVRIAPLLGRASGRVALHNEQLGLAGVFFVAVGQLAGHAVCLQRALAAHQVARFLRRGARAGGLGRFLQNCLGDGRVFLKILAQRLVHKAGDQRLDVGVAQLGLGLALELRLLQFHADDRDQTLAHVGAFEVVVLILQNAFGARVLVEHAGQAQLEALLVGAALRRVDVVGKAEHQLVEAVAVLHRDLGHCAVRFAFHIDDLRVQRAQIAALLQVGDEFLDAAFIAHGIAAGLAVVFGQRFGALIGQRDAHAGVQKRFFAQALEQDLIVINSRIHEHFRVRLEGNGRAGRSGRADFFQLPVRLAAHKALLILGAVAAHLHHEPFGQRVDHAGADAVQAARDLVAGILAAELAARMQHGVHDGHGRDAHFGLDINRNAAAVVGHADDVALLDRDLDVGAVPGQRFVDGVVDDLIHQMVQAGRPRRADIHAGALTHGLQPLQHLDLRAAVFVVGRGILVGGGDDLFCHE